MATPRGEILVIDHNRSIREMTIAALEFEQYKVTGAAHVAEALSILETWTPHLILMNAWLPLIDGWEFLAAYRQRAGAPVPIIVCTTNMLDQVRAMRAGAVACLAQPFDLDVEPHTALTGEGADLGQRSDALAADIKRL